MRRSNIMLRGILVLSLVAVLPSVAHAQTGAWPNKPIRMIAPFPPGGTTDQLARVLSPLLTQALGQQVIAENRSGGGGSIGTGQVAKSAPDGYTFVLVFDTHAVNPSIIPNLPFDTRKDLTPVTLIATGPMVVVAHRAQPMKNFTDFIAAARQRAGGLTYGTIGSGSLGHLAMSQMGALGKFSATHVPYKGGGPLVQDSIAGHVPVAIATTALFSQHIRAGTLTALAVTSAKRDPELSSVPTVSEQGIPGFDAVAWWGVLAPAKTPPAIIQRMHEEIVKILQLPTIRERLTTQGMDIVAGPPEVLGKFVDSQITRWAQVVKEFGIQAGD